MKNLKFRTPIICHNGHKGFWTWILKDSAIAEPENIMVVSDCCCQETELGDNWKKDGENQVCINLPDKKGRILYEGDVLVDRENALYVVMWVEAEAKFILSLIKGNINSYFEVTLNTLYLSVYTCIGNNHEHSEWIGQ